jgi:exonuclease VII large subunit
MDQELKQYLDAMESRMDARMETRLGATEERMVTLMTSVKESLERQIEGVASRFDAQAIRLDRQAALLQTGARWTNRMIAWAEKVDVSLGDRIQEISELRRRMEKLEGGAK